MISKLIVILLMVLQELHSQQLRNRMVPYHKHMDQRRFLLKDHHKYLVSQVHLHRVSLNRHLLCLAILNKEVPHRLVMGSKEHPIRDMGSNHYPIQDMGSR